MPKLLSLLIALTSVFILGSYSHARPTKARPAKDNSSKSFKRTVKRSVIAKANKDLTTTLQQARMVPNIVPGSGGKVDGFRFADIEPGSFYALLGFEVNDIVKSIDDTKLNSPVSVMKFLEVPMKKSKYKMIVERKGHDQIISYEVID